jgi:hypothetical protein
LHDLRFVEKKQGRCASAVITAPAFQVFISGIFFIAIIFS